MEFCAKGNYLSRGEELESGIFGWLTEIYLFSPKIWVHLSPSGWGLMCLRSCWPRPCRSSLLAWRAYSNEREVRAYGWNFISSFEKKILALILLLLHLWLNFSFNLGFSILSDYSLGPMVMMTLRNWHQHNSLFRSKEKLKNLDVSDFLHDWAFYECKLSPI